MTAPAFGVHVLPSTGANVGPFLIAYEDWLNAYLADNPGIEHLIYEATFFGPQTQRHILLKLYGLQVKTEEIAWHHQIRVREANLQSWRKVFLGTSAAPKHIKGRANRSKWLKDEAIHACLRRGWMVTDDNEADACGILDYTLGCDDKAYKDRTFTLTP